MGIIWPFPNIATSQIENNQKFPLAYEKSHRKVIFQKLKLI